MIEEKQLLPPRTPRSDIVREGIYLFDQIVMLTTRSMPFSLTVLPRFVYLPLPFNDLHRLCGLAVAG
jgi:hypothetical protein